MRTPVLAPAPTPPPDVADAPEPPPSAPRGKRRELDFYETNGELTDALLRHVKIPPKSTVAEPCNGHGAITRRLLERVHELTVRTFDVDAAKAPEVVADARALAYPPEVAAVITNPPFSDAFEILVNAHKQGLDVAFLLRMSFLEPTVERGEWLAANPPDLVIVCPRESFTGNGLTDSVTCAWMVWINGASASSGAAGLYIRESGTRIELTASWRAKKARDDERKARRRGPAE